MPKTKTERRTDRRRFPALKAGLWVGALAVLGLGSAWVERGQQWQAVAPIRYVRVEGDLWNLDAESFRTALLPFAESGYFTLDLAGIEAEARKFAWVDQVHVQRLWPDILLVRVEEQKPVARWGEQGLLNARGEPFQPERSPGYDSLPILTGPDGQEKQMLSVLRALDGKLESRQLRVQKLRLSKRRAWVAELTGGVEIEFGKQDPLPAMDRLLVLLPKLGEDRVAAIRKVDLRYPNGFSVVFRQDPPATPDILGRGASWRAGRAELARIQGNIIIQRNG